MDAATKLGSETLSGQLPLSRPRSSLPEHTRSAAVYGEGRGMTWF